jgi:ribosomal protein S18 acetylase RimI-like enzyme
VATVADLDELVRMREALDVTHRAENEHLWPSAQGVFEGRYRKWLEEPSYRLLVATMEASTIGMAIGSVHQNPAFGIPSFGVIEDVWVDAEHRRRGIAKALIKELVAFFRERGTADITLIWVHGSPAASMWKNLGFEPVLVTANTKLDDLAKKTEG